MNNVDKLLNFLKQNNHQYIKNVLKRFNEIENNRKHNSAKYKVADLKKLEKETGLKALDMDKLVKYYDILKERNLLDKIIGKGDDVEYADEVVASTFYLMNTYSFMERFKEDYTNEDLDNAIWDPTYDPVIGFKVD